VFHVTGVQTCALPISASRAGGRTALRPSPPGKEPVASGPLRPDLPPLRAYPPPEAENGSPPLSLRRLRRPSGAAAPEVRPKRPRSEERRVGQDCGVRG